MYLLRSIIVMSFLKSFGEIIRRGNRKRTSARRRRIGQPESLESRELLTIGLNFEFTTIASDLSDTHRFFGSQDPSDAPFEIIRYGEGRLTSFENYELYEKQTIWSNPLFLDPSLFTFQFGSMDASNPVEALTLTTFDDGVTDGFANQVYQPDGNDVPTVQFFYDGTRLGDGSMLELSLQTAPDGTVTGTSSQLRFFENQPQLSSTPRELPAARNFLEQSARSASNTLPVISFTLSEFQLDGTWTGAGDAEIFSSTGHSTLTDDFPNDRDLATLETFTESVPLTGAINWGGDYDVFRVHMDSSLMYTLQLQADELTQIDFVDENFTDGVTRVQHSLLDTASGTFQIEGAAEMGITILPRQSLPTDYVLSIVSTEPKTFWTQFDASTNTATWTPPVDENGDPAAVDSYVVAQHAKVEGLFRGNGEFHRTTVAAGASQFTLVEPAVLGTNYVRMGRVVGGEVVEWSNAAEYQNDVRPVLDPVSNRTITWPDLPGDPQRVNYEIAINNIDTGVNNIIREVIPDNSYTLPSTLGLGNYEAFVRGISDQRWGWSRGVRFTSRTAVTLDPVANSATPTITWPALAGADRYQVYIQNRTTGAIVANDSNVTTNSYTPPADFGLGEYIVWARAIDANGRSAQWSAPERFSVRPTPTDVTFGANSLRPTFNWTLPAGTSSVNLYIRNGSNAISESVTGTSWTPDSDLVAAPTTWWIQGETATGAKAGWTKADILGLDRAVITNVTAQTYGQWSFDWSVVPDTASYTVWLTRVGDQRVLLQEGLTDTQFQVNTFGGGYYALWINAVDSGGNSRWSRRSNFQVISADGDGPYIISPINQTTSNTPTLSWVPVENANSYRIWISPIGDNGRVLAQGLSNAQHSYTVTTPLPSGAYRFWIGVEGGPFVVWGAGRRFDVA